MKIINKLIWLLLLLQTIASSNDIIIPNNKSLIYGLGQQISKNYRYGLEDFKFIQKFENRINKYSDYYSSQDYYIFDSNVDFFHWYRDKFRIQELQRIFNISYETKEEIYEFIIKEYFEDLIKKSVLNLNKKHNIELKITEFLKFHRDKTYYRIISGNPKQIRNSLLEFIDLTKLLKIVKNSKLKWNSAITSDGYINHPRNSTYDLPKYLLHIDTDLENKFKVNITIICVDCEGIYIKDTPKSVVKEQFIKTDIPIPNDILKNLNGTWNFSKNIDPAYCSGGDSIPLKIKNIVINDYNMIMDFKNNQKKICKINSYTPLYGSWDIVSKRENKYFNTIYEPHYGSCGGNEFKLGYESYFLVLNTDKCGIVSLTGQNLEKMNVPIHSTMKFSPKNGLGFEIYFLTKQND